MNSALRQKLFRITLAASLALLPLCHPTQKIDERFKDADVVIYDSDCATLHIHFQPPSPPLDSIGFSRDTALRVPVRCAGRFDLQFARKLHQLRK